MVERKLTQFIQRWMVNDLKQRELPRTVGGCVVVRLNCRSTVRMMLFQLA